MVTIDCGALPETLLESELFGYRAGAFTGADGAGTLEEMEARFLREVLARHRWNRQEAARELGIHKTTLHRKIRRLVIQLPSTDGRSTRRK